MAFLPLVAIVPELVTVTGPPFARTAANALRYDPVGSGPYGSY